MCISISYEVVTDTWLLSFPQLEPLLAFLLLQESTVKKSPELAGALPVGGIPTTVVPATWIGSAVPANCSYRTCNRAAAVSARKVPATLVPATLIHSADAPTNCSSRICNSAAAAVSTSKVPATGVPAFRWELRDINMDLSRCKEIAWLLLPHWRFGAETALEETSSMLVGCWIWPCWETLKDLCRKKIQDQLC